MENNREDEMLNEFFNKNKNEIQDFGFSSRVVRNLPQTRDRSWIIWLSGATGFVIALLLGLYNGVIQTLYLLIQLVPQLYILASVTLFLLLSGTIVLYLEHSKNKMIRL